MKVIICGAGQVGSNIARTLAQEDHDVTVIDQSDALVRRIGETLNVQAMTGFASRPDVLQAAGASDADMLIAVTHTDEVNMVACQVAHALFNVPTKIARVRDQAYLDPVWSDLFSRDHLGIDVIISPEIEVARAISRRLVVPGSTDTIPLASGQVQAIGVRLFEDCPVLRTPLRQLTGIFPDLEVNIVAVIRGEHTLVPGGDDQLLPGDEIYFVAKADHVARAMAAFGHEEKLARRLTVAGGGHIGLFFAQLVERDHPGVTTKLIEFDAERAVYIADRLKKTVVIKGDVLDPEILDEANVATTETFVAVTNNDEVNILGSLQAKRLGATRVITLINNLNYIDLVNALGIDTLVNPRAITVSTILQHVRRGRIRAVHALREGIGEIIEAELLDTSDLGGIPIREAELPDGVIFGAILRGEQIIIPDGDTILRAKDRVVLFALAEAVREVEDLFAVRLEYF
jgi:trk system potassium uptake protein TrkA